MKVFPSLAKSASASSPRTAGYSAPWRRYFARVGRELGTGRRSPAILSSPRPASGWPRICSIRVEPDRGNPTMKIGALESWDRRVGALGEELGGEQRHGASHELPKSLRRRKACSSPAEPRRPRRSAPWLQPIRPGLRAPCRVHSGNAAGPQPRSGAGDLSSPSPPLRRPVKGRVLRLARLQPGFTQRGHMKGDGAAIGGDTLLPSPGRLERSGRN